MLGSFIRHGLTQEEAAGEALLQIIAGSDTSASTIRMVMLYLLSNPDAYRKLQQEIDAGIDAGTISSPIKDAEARQMPYLQAVIKEGLRIIPPAGGAFYKTVPPGGDVIEGKFIPAGTQIGSSPFGIHHSKKLFGPDAELYRPERWLEADQEQASRMASTVDLVFHYGKYQCLGKTVALMEFNKIFVEVSILSLSPPPSLLSLTLLGPPRQSLPIVRELLTIRFSSFKLLRRFDFSIVRPQNPARIRNAVSNKRYTAGGEGEEGNGAKDAGSLVVFWN